VARAAYWRGRAAEAAGQLEEMRAHYQAAASYPVAYYGQLARARLGLNDVGELRSPPEPADAQTSEALAPRVFSIGSARATLPWHS
jgi:soluble lytic murein transglycosylase